MKTIKKLFKILAFVALAVALATVFFTGVLKQEPVEYIAPAAPAVEEPEPVDNVSEAQKQLDEAKRLLAEEEEKLLAEIATKEARLEEIREVRLSFSQAPTPAQ